MVEIIIKIELPFGPSFVCCSHLVSLSLCAVLPFLCVQQQHSLSQGATATSLSGSPRDACASSTSHHGRGPWARDISGRTCVLLSRPWDLLPQRICGRPLVALKWPVNWRLVTNRTLTSTLRVTVVTTTARFLYQDFHVELVERTAVPIFDDDSSSESESTSRSSGRRLRQQHAGLEHS